MNEQLTLGSLFDGSGSFPFGGMLIGIKPIWASEVEPFPILVTRTRMPEVKHLGNICSMNGAEIPPVDIITFGSPCQDMSIAGKRAGLDGSRSNLFFEAIRVIKEMRCATHGKYPRYIVWENVAGAFSSNRGNAHHRYHYEKISEAIKMKREQIDTDLPRFVGAIAQEIKTDHNVLSILEKHKDTFSPYFREELEITIADMRSSNWEAAITRFEGRIGSTQLSEVTRGLIEMARGSDTHVYWETLIYRFSEYQKQILRNFALKIPPKINRLSMVLLFVMLLLYVVVLGTTMFDSFGTLFSF